ncbi:MAG: hypothetical protein V4466_14495 [Pseudomonadota bacterium]
MVQPLGDRGHDVVVAQVGGVVVQLLLQVAGVQARKARRAEAVPLTLLAVAAEAGGAHAAFAAAQGDQFAGRREGFSGPVGRRSASGGKARGEDQEQNGAHVLPTPNARRSSGQGTGRAEAG